MKPLTVIDTYSLIGLQTPRLKRLAEIVSTQAMAQQERAIDEEPISDGEAV